jgi:exodeoxyribonuclease VII large subunit
MLQRAAGSPSDGTAVLSVSQLARRARLLIEEHLGWVTVEGELSNFRRPGSGHWYFTLKDASAQVRCAMFTSRNRLVRMAVEDGLMVRVTGRVSLYEPRGDFQLIVDRMTAAGEGALRAAFDALKEKLAGEGLFDEARKRPLPPHPRHLTIISSPSGAALRDVLHVIERRFAGLEVLLIPSAVQGDAAEQELLAALRSASASSTDVVLLTRGGGSLEDLWAFNLESVARAVAACPHPVVSAIGHQTDFAITDFVADVRAPTPSAAAELITPTTEELARDLDTSLKRLTRAVTQETRYLRQRLAASGSRLLDPATLIALEMRRVDELEARLIRAWQVTRQRNRDRVAGLERSLTLLTPTRRIRDQLKLTRDRRTRLVGAMNRQVANARRSVAAQARALAAVSPLNTLSRGFSVLTTPDRSRTVSSTMATAAGEQLTALLADGTLALTVTAIDHAPPLENPDLGEEIP